MRLELENEGISKEELEKLVDAEIEREEAEKEALIAERKARVAEENARAERAVWESLEARRLAQERIAREAAMAPIESAKAMETARLEQERKVWYIFSNSLFCIIIICFFVFVCSCVNYFSCFPQKGRRRT